MNFIKIYLCRRHAKHENLQYQTFPENPGQLTQKRHHENPFSKHDFDGGLFFRDTVFGNRISSSDFKIEGQQCRNDSFSAWFCFVFVIGFQNEYRLRQMVGRKKTLGETGE